MTKEDEFDKKASELVFWALPFRVALEEMNDVELKNVIAEWARKNWGKRVS